MKPPTRKPKCMFDILCWDPKLKGSVCERESERESNRGNDCKHTAELSCSSVRPSESPTLEGISQNP